MRVEESPEGCSAIEGKVNPNGLPGGLSHGAGETEGLQERPGVWYGIGLMSAVPGIGEKPAVAPGR